MFDFIFGDFSTYQIIILMVAAVLIGINKTGMPGLGLLPVVMLALSFPTGLSTGLQLMMLCMADVMAVSYYRRRANWKLVFKLLPCAIIGIILGSLTMRFVDDKMLSPVIGIIILLLTVVNYLRNRFLNSENVPDNMFFIIGVGLTAGFTTQIANAAGPIMALYLLAMRLPKEEYMGTCAWYFMILNWLKLPIFFSEGRITLQALYADLSMIPLIMIGAILGIVFVRKAPQKVFEWIIQILIVISSLKLLFPGGGDAADIEVPLEVPGE